MANGFFMNMVNVAGIAAFVLWRTAHGLLHEPTGEERKHFLTRLYTELTYEQIMRRKMTSQMPQLVAGIMHDRDEAAPPGPSVPKKTLSHVSKRA